MKKLLAMVLALVMTLSLAVSANALKADEKINEDYAEAVAVLDGMGVFKGYEDGSFKPENKITRAEVATIIYRIYTADVAKNDKSGLYATYNKFSDMAGAGWAAGYIGYCANAEFVKGYPDGTFKPSGNVTGYEVLAMILRAVGYDKNGEFTGADWALNVAKYAEQLGILDNVAKTTDLSAPATRELVAEILFRAIQSPMVTYTAAFGYQNVGLNGDKDNNKTFKNNISIGTKNFYLASKDSNDDWGRPVKVWYNTKTDASYAKLTKAADAAFHVAATECEICEALAEKKGATISNAYFNGEHVEKYNKDISATATKATLGAQGQQIEFYAENDDDGTYRMVVIDTYLAQVEKVVTEKLDGKGHVTRDDYVELTVYGLGNPYYVAGNDYAEGDWLLVNVNAEAKAKLVLTTNATASKVALVEVVGKADSFDGAQSKILSKAYKHIIDGKEYMDAYQFILDEAQADGSVNYTWFLDQFGNLIGSIAIDNTNYAVLKDIEWVGGKGAHAQATIVYMDGEEASVEVASIDGLEYEDGFKGDFNFAFDNAVPEQGDTGKDDNGFKSNQDEAIARVSTSDRYNKGYRGMALYMVETNKDGSVNLQGLVPDGREYDHVVWYTGTGATIKTNTSVITDANGYKVTSLDDNTKFLVRETKDGGKTYEYHTYTLNTLPDYASKSVEAYYTLNTTGKFATRVYIKISAAQSDFGHYILVPEYDKVKDAIIGRVLGEIETWEADVYVDGKLQTIRTDAEIAATLQANEGKLFEVSYNEDYDLDGDYYGYVNNLELMNEHTDVDTFTGDKWMADYVTNGEWSKDGNTLASNGISWRTGKATFVSAEGKELKSIDDIDLDEDGVWVVSDASVEEGQALFVYVGQKLKDDTYMYAFYTTDKMTNNEYKDLEFKYNTHTEMYETEVTLAAGEKVASYHYGTESVRYLSNLQDFDFGEANMNTYVSEPGDVTWLMDDGVTMYLNGANGPVTLFTGDFWNEVETNQSVRVVIKVTAEDGVTEQYYKIVINNGRELCTSTALTYLTKAEKFRTYDIDIADKVVNVYLNGNETVTVGQLMEVLYVNDGTAEKPVKCTHATIAPSNSQVGTAAVLNDLLKVGQTDFILTVTPESGTPVNYTVSIH